MKFSNTKNRNPSTLNKQIENQNVIHSNNLKKIDLEEVVYNWDYEFIRYRLFMYNNKILKYLFILDIKYNQSGQ